MAVAGASIPFKRAAASDGLEGIQRALPRRRMIDDGRGVVSTEAQACASQDLRGRGPWRMEPPIGQTAEFWNPPADIVAVCIEFLPLGDRIEDSEVR